MPPITATLKLISQAGSLLLILVALYTVLLLIYTFIEEPIKTYLNKIKAKKEKIRVEKLRQDIEEEIKLIERMVNK